MSITIDKLTTLPIDASEDVSLIPPGAVKVTDKTGADLFAIRFNSADLTGTLNGAVSSRGSEGDTAGILFQNDAEELLDGNLIFSSGKMNLSASGSGEVAGIYGGEVVMTVAGGLQLAGSLNVSSKSGTSAQATGIEADAKFESELAFAMNVKADASKGDDADADGLVGAIAMPSTSDKFKLTVQAKAGSGSAYADGVEGSLSGSGQLGGTLTVKADASKGENASASGINGETQVGSVSDKFKLDIQAKAGTGEARAYGFSGSSFTVDGTLGGTVTTFASNSGRRDDLATAISIGFYANTQVADVSSKFKLTSQAKSVSADAGAAGFVEDLVVAGTLGGNFTAKSDSKSGRAVAAGFDGSVQAAGVSDKFKLTVTAKSGSGMAEAWGFTTTDIASGLSGKITVTAISKSNTAEATGGTLSSSSTFRTAAANDFAVTAQTSGGTVEALAYGITGSSGNVDLAGVLAVTAKGKIGSAYGVYATSGEVTGSISGVVAAVGSMATGISGGDASALTISGAVYAGTKGNAAGIAKSLNKSVGTGKSAAGMNKNADQAVNLGAGSTLTLTDGSIVIGDVTLGTGSTLDLSTGSQLYGAIDMNASGTLNFTVDGTLTKAAAVTLSTDSVGVFAPTSGVNLTITATDVTQLGSYVLLAGSNLSDLSGVDFNTLFDLIGFDTHGFDVAWDLDLSGKTDTLTLILSQDIGGGSSQPVEATTDLLSATDLNSATQMLASSSFTESATSAGASFWKNSLIA